MARGAERIVELAEDRIAPAGGAAAVEQRRERAALDDVRRRLEPERVEDRRHDVDRLNERPARRAASRVGARPRVDDDHRHAHRLLVEQLLLAEAVIAEMVAVVGGEDDQRVLRAAAAVEVVEHAAQVVVDLLDEPHVGRPHVAHYLLAAVAQAVLVRLAIGLQHRVRVLGAGVGAHDAAAVGVAVHRVVRRWCHQRPVRLDVRQVQHPRPVALRLQVLERAVGHVGRLGVTLLDARRPVRVAQQPAVGLRALLVERADDKFGPRVGAVVAVGAQVIGVARLAAGRRMAVVAVEFAEVAVQAQPRLARVARQAEPLEASGVRDDVRLAGERRVATGLREVVAESDLAGRERHVVPGRTVAADVAPGVEAHPRRHAHR